jgi:hypothetical protein
MTIFELVDRIDALADRLAKMLGRTILDDAGGMEVLTPHLMRDLRMGVVAIFDELGLYGLAVDSYRASARAEEDVEGLCQLLAVARQLAEPVERQERDTAK